MFEFAGCEYTEALKEVGGDSWEPQLEIINKIRSSGINRTAFAVPIVTHNDDFILSQSAAIGLFIAELFPDLRPKNILEMARGRQVK